MTAAAAKNRIKTVNDIVVSATEWSRVSSDTQARIWDGRLHWRIHAPGDWGYTLRSTPVDGRKAREVVDAWGLGHCDECREHYGDIGICDEGKAVRSPHAPKIAAARLAGARR